jgi:hypothetical protein
MYNQMEISDRVTLPEIIRKISLATPLFYHTLQTSERGNMQGGITQNIAGVRGGSRSQRTWCARGDALGRDNKGEADMCWKVELIVDDSGEWEGDPLRFETEQQALAYARDLEFRWSAVREKRIVKSEDSAN